MAIGGETHDYVAALVIIDFENVGHWAEKRGIGYTTFIDLSQKPEINHLVLEAVEGVNQNLPPSGQVRRFILMHKEFDADEAEKYVKNENMKSSMYPQMAGMNKK